MNDPQKIWIAGAGKAGSRAAESIVKAWPAAELHIIDTRITALNSLPGQKHQQEAASFLLRNLNREDSPALIIPCVPVHLAYEWIYQQVQELHGEKMPVPEGVIEKLPYAVKGKDGGVSASLANFICPGDCPEPEDHCFKTGEKRPYNLHEYLAKIHEKGYYSLVIVSHQIFPGIGGYRPQQLFKALHLVRERKYQKFLISTSCKCHAVMHCLQISSTA